MASFYELREMPDIDGSGKKVVFPRFCNARQVSTGEVAESISAGSTFSPGDVVGLLRALSDKIAVEASRGNSVKLDGIGIFSPSLSFRGNVACDGVVENVTTPNALSVVLSGMKFRADKALVAKAGEGIELVRRKPEQMRSSTQYTAEQRLAIALDYLKTHGSLSVSVYRELTGLLRTAATTELLRWSETVGSGIVAEGRGSHKRYVAG